ncbi:MAG: threonylcarbamoyl-AMP synthase, partial [Candidatus Nanohaloarchaea archaeon]
NIAGKETSYSVDVISKKLLEEADHVIDRGKLKQKPTSTIVEIQEDNKLEVHREGPIKKQEIEKTLQR